MTKEKTYKLDIKVVVDNIINKNYDFYKKLSIDDKKGFTSFVTYGWLSRVCSYNELLKLNELNKYIFSFNNHQLLVVQLLTTCFSKKKSYQKWVQFPKKISYNKTVQLISEYFNYSFKEAKETFELLTISDIIQMAEELGYQKDQIDAIRKENSTTTSSR